MVLRPVVIMVVAEISSARGQKSGFRAYCKCRTGPTISFLGGSWNCGMQMSRAHSSIEINCLKLGDDRELQREVEFRPKSYVR